MVTGIDLDRLIPGFSDPVLNSQQTFRAVLDAMAHPGRIVAVSTALEPPRPFNLASAAVCFTLLDFETPLWTDFESHPMGLWWLRFHCACSVVRDPLEAIFALIAYSDSMPSLNDFKIGADACPEASTTLIIQVNGLGSRDGKRLTGPGIETYETLAVEGLSKRFWEDRRIQSAMYPLGVDVIFTCKNKLAALPRTTKVES